MFFFFVSPSNFSWHSNFPLLHSFCLLSISLCMLIRFCLLQTAIWKINQIIPNVTKVANWSLKVFPCCCSPSVALIAVVPNDSSTCSGSDLIPGVCAKNIVQRSCVAWHDCATRRIQSSQQSGQVMCQFTFCVSQQLTVKSSVHLPSLKTKVTLLRDTLSFTLCKKRCGVTQLHRHIMTVMLEKRGGGAGGRTTPPPSSPHPPPHHNHPTALPHPPPPTSLS